MITTLCLIFSLFCQQPAENKALTGTENQASHQQEMVIKKHHHVSHRHHRRSHVTTSHKRNVSAGVTKSHAPTSTINREQLFEQFRAWCYLHHPGEDCYVSGH